MSAGELPKVKIGGVVSCSTVLSYEQPNSSRRKCTPKRPIATISMALLWILKAAKCANSKLSAVKAIEISLRDDLAKFHAVMPPCKIWMKSETQKHVHSRCFIFLLLQEDGSRLTSFVCAGDEAQYLHSGNCWKKASPKVGVVSHIAR